MITREEIRTERQLKGFCCCKHCLDEDMKQAEFRENFLNLIIKFPDEMNLENIKAGFGETLNSFSLGDSAIFKTIKKGDIITIDLMGKKFKVKVKRKIKKGEELIVETV